ncbi:hypothetical protein CC85DRAFT_313658 [Cutaneotrichosporon oleaginosum]|uniref:Uncharacterized protein n=1 Tax=Cutaneotrichosporon oleaginosum TaxID=879819 RepID=A0A0J0XFI9_9TREE|nr:uncharacterized protein CC85DRAFT_313658 [Cutaneotrichosporon oleaginosum]KLT39818.1 hypothetical protein CC85DRAFT_313658 [Cutaneotrichosporon oleaginosum]TXT10342.1 hypothetical protein COLE_04276 [Cutaneotrichosporon oleaginosum]
MTIPPYNHVSSHTGRRYRALDSHSLRLHCSRVNLQLHEEEVTRRLLFVLAQYGQIRYISVLMRSDVHRDRYSPATHPSTANSSPDTGTMPVSTMALDAYVVFVNQTDAVKAFCMPQADREILGPVKIWSEDAQKIIISRLEPNFVFVTPEGGWIKVPVNELSIYQSSIHLALALRMTAPLRFLLSEVQTFVRHGPIQIRDAASLWALPNDRHGCSPPCVNSFDYLPSNVHIRHHTAASEPASPIAPERLPRSRLVTGSRYTRAGSSVRWRSPSPKFTKTPRDRSRSPPAARSACSRAEWTPIDNHKSSSLYPYVWPSASPQ